MIKSKTNLFRAAAAAALLLGCIPRALAVGERIHSYEPIRTGDPRMDSLADELLSRFPAGKPTRKNSGRL